LPGAVVLTLLLSAAVADLAAEAASSSRPRACPPLVSSSGSSRHALWQRVRQRALAGYCHELARAQILLVTSPDEALEAAQALAAKWPAQGEPKRLAARALTRLGRADEAWALWVSSTGGSVTELDIPGTLALHDYALAAALTGHDDAALAAYRALVTRAASLADPAYSQRLLVEASLAALRVDVSPEDASGYLGAAAEIGSSQLLATYGQGVELLGDVLRPGSAAEPPVIDASAAWQFLRQVESPTARPSWPSVPRHELLGVAALVIESHSRERALELWREYVAGLEARGAAAGDATSRARVKLTRLLGRAKAEP
jgi:hypothetical protein